jgi:hypothetical protein
MCLGYDPLIFGQRSPAKRPTQGILDGLLCDRMSIDARQSGLWVDAVPEDRRIMLSLSLRLLQLSPIRYALYAERAA